MQGRLAAKHQLCNSVNRPDHLLQHLVSYHTHSQACDCRAGLHRDIKFATVVTDLTTCHNTWFHKDVDRCFVATQEAKARALKMGIGQHKVTVHGLPIRPAFSQKLASKRKLRQQLGLDLQKPAVLLVGGSPCSALIACVLALRAGAPRLAVQGMLANRSCSDIMGVCVKPHAHRMMQQTLPALEPSVCSQ